MNSQDYPGDTIVKIRVSPNDMIKKVIFTLAGLLFATTLFASDYLIGEGDTLSVSVWGEKDFSFTAKVRPDGKITVPTIGELTAASMTAKKLQEILTEKLKSVVRKPVVTVAVTEITNNKVYVFGGGVKAGVFTLGQRTTLLQLLCQLEDIRKADLQNAYLMRGKLKLEEDFTKLYLKGDVDQDIVIEPNDIIFIPVRIDSYIYVMGAVAKPMPIEYHDGISVMEAILSAGGFTPYANPDETIIYRKDKNKDLAINAKIKRLMNDGDLSQNVPLRAGDYVLVKQGLF
ncbi:MAG TPA: polysaccharide biosynthesis/export family protein [Nitrospirota bacterium]|nr:polysaccharide biosynthesis/export family protein [Nitrospirota bacterium]